MLGLRSKGQELVRATFEDPTIYPPGVARLKDPIRKRSSWKATDEATMARICHVALRIVLCQRKVRLQHTCQTVQSVLRVLYICKVQARMCARVMTLDLLLAGLASL